MSDDAPALDDPPDALIASLDIGAVSVTGGDRIDFLNNVLSQDVTAIGPGRVAGALHLDAQGRPLAVSDVVVLDDRVLLLLPSVAEAEGLAERLGSRTFLADARFLVLPVGARALRGRRARDVAEAIGAADLVVPLEDDQPADATSTTAATCPAVEHHGCVLVGRWGGLDLVGPPEALADLVARLEDAGAVAVTTEALEAWRVAHGVPAWSSEIRAPHLPEEVGLLPTHVHLAKGCYPGQEAVARMWMLGRPRRRLAQVVLDGAAEAGWQAGSGRSAVEVTSAARFAGEPVGLAYVPADAAEGDRFEGPDGAVTVRRIIGEGLPIPGRDPSVQRRRDRR